MRRAHLVATGHRRIAHIAGWGGSTTGRDRALGFREGLAAHGLEPAAVLDGMYDREVAAAATRAIFGRPDRPDAVFVGSDHMAFAVMDTLRGALGLRVPEDVAVIGYDDVPMAAWDGYALTTLRQDAGAMVAAAVGCLMARLDDPRTPPRRIRLPAPLVARRSTRPLAEAP